MDIAIGANGTAWVIGTNRAPYLWGGKKWGKLPGSNLANLTLDRNGNPWATNTKKEILAGRMKNVGKRFSIKK